jgi:hypothetical protein
VPREKQRQEFHLVSTRADPLASLRLFGVKILLSIGVFDIPALPAATWLEVLLDEDFQAERVFPGLCDDEATTACYEGLIDGSVSEQDIADAVMDALEVVSGRRWWITLRLSRVAREHWDLIGGGLALAGIRADQVSLGMWLDALYALIVERLASADPESCAQFTQTLTTAPASTARDEVDEVTEGNAFLASMKMAM